MPATAPLRSRARVLLISVSSEVNHSFTPLSATVTGFLKPTSSPSLETIARAKAGLPLSSPAEYERGGEEGGERGGKRRGEGDGGGAGAAGEGAAGGGEKARGVGRGRSFERWS